MRQIIKDRKQLGLELLPACQTRTVNREWPKNSFGGLISYLIVICEMSIHLIKTSLCLETLIRFLSNFTGFDI